MGITDKSVEKYINRLQPLFDGPLGEIQHNALQKNIPIVPAETARFIATLLSTLEPENILEIGCAVGFSAGLMCKYLKDNGHITTIDRFDVMINEAKTNFKKLAIEDKVTLIEGDACHILPEMNTTFDFIFLDGAKGQYIQLLPHCLRLLKTGGVLLADDVMQDGRIAADRFAIPRRQRTIQARMRQFLYAATNTQGLESSIIPIGDGLLYTHKTRKFKEINYGKF